MTGQPLRAAVDIGGTFTDIQIADTATGERWEHKVSSTQDPSAGLIDGLCGALTGRGRALGELGMILHGSTIATNAVLERKLPVGGLITTQGFTDVLAIGRHMRRDIYALKAEPRPVLIPAERRFGVAERIRADGTVETPLDRGAVADAGHRLADQGVTAIAVAFLHAYRNPAHEQEAAEILSVIPGLTVATSHETSPEIREFERTSTTVLNALLKPVISTYLDRVEAALAGAGILARLFLVQSNGGVATPAEAARLPVGLLLSGPSGGAMAIAGLAERHGLASLVGMDMGGTSTDVCVLHEGRIEETAMAEVDGLPVRLPMIEIRTIGASGGSIARAEHGALRIGPESAGAAPGPACYRRDGVEPTVTDANLALGLLDPSAFLGGGMELSREAAEIAIDDVARGLAMDATEAAGGIVAVANAAMADAVRLSLFEKGADPADFVLTAFGGAGGLHACAVAEELDMRCVMFPASASTLSALGILGSDIRHDLIVARLVRAAADASGVLGKLVNRLRQRSLDLLRADGIPSDRQRVEILADMRYRGQAWEITVPWPAAADGVSPDAIIALTDAFHALHHARYAHSAPDDAVEIAAIRARATGLLEKIGHGQPLRTFGTATESQRQVYVAGQWQTVPVTSRAAIDAPHPGPLIVEEPYATLWIAPGWTVRAAPGGDLIAEREGRTP